jgi:NitT/TauT family transport system permease protein
VYRFEGIQKWKRLYLPGIFPALVTGWVTAAGGAWNASIVSECTSTPPARRAAPRVWAR